VANSVSTVRPQADLCWCDDRHHRRYRQGPAIEASCVKHTFIDHQVGADCSDGPSSQREALGILSQLDYCASRAYSGKSPEDDSPRGNRRRGVPLGEPATPLKGRNSESERLKDPHPFLFRSLQGLERSSHAPGATLFRRLPLAVIFRAFGACLSTAIPNWRHCGRGPASGQFAH